MKRMIRAAQAGASADLYVQYLDFDGMSTGNVLLRSMTVKRPTLSEALTVMLEHIELRELDLDYDDMVSGNYTKAEMIEAIEYANSAASDSDIILYLENRASGEVFIDNVAPEENY